jgi:hypothetical protein
MATMDWPTLLTGMALTTSVVAAAALVIVVLDLRRRLRQAVETAIGRQDGGMRRLAEHIAALQTQNRALQQRVDTLEIAYRHVVAEMQGRERDGGERPGRLLN